MVVVSGWMFKFKHVHWVEKYGVCVMELLKVIFHHPFICTGAIHVKLNTLV